MRMDDEQESRNVDDRRASSGGGGRGLPSMGTMMMIWPFVKPLLRTKFGWAIIALGAVAYFSGFNVLSLVGMGGGTSSNTKVNKVKDDKQSVFISKVLRSTEEVWNKVLPQYGMKYKEPIMVLYRNGTSSGCGQASSQMGPFYCPADQKVYLDLGFFDELSSRHNAPGDFAQAYVLAHEIGHHIQNMQGTLNKVQKLKQQLRSETKSNRLQVRVELQADCYAGVWAHHAHQNFNILEQGDVEEALVAAGSIGDDTLMKKAGRSVRPDGFTHGSSAQRIEWFKRGLLSGKLDKCNTLNNI